MYVLSICTQMPQSIRHSKAGDFCITKTKMKKILIHKNSGNPIYIARTDEGIYHVIHQDKSMSAHNSIGMAIDSAANGFLIYNLRAIDGWLTC